MDKANLINQINEILAEEFEVEVSTIKPDGSIKMTLALDSLSLIDMVAVVENVWGVKIAGTDMASIKKFSDLYDYIYEKIEK